MVLAIVVVCLVLCAMNTALLVMVLRKRASVNLVSVDAVTTVKKFIDEIAGLLGDVESSKDAGNFFGQMLCYALEMVWNQDEKSGQEFHDIVKGLMAKWDSGEWKISDVQKYLDSTVLATPKKEPITNDPPGNK